MSDSIENILIGLVRDSNDHIDKINNSVLSNNALLQTLVEKVTKIEEENKCLREKMDSVIETNTLLREKIEHLEKPKQSRRNRVKFLKNLKSSVRQ